jgi:hypothetical protein
VSWDILIVDLPRDAQTVSGLPNDFKPRPLGSRRDLITAILSAAPTADFSDPAWGQILAKDFTIEVSMGKAEQTASVMLHVRGGQGAVALIAKILDRLNARALDIQTGEIFQETTAATSFATWRAYRDRVINQPGQASR